MYPLKTTETVRKLKGQRNVRSLPAIADRAIREKITKSRAGEERDNTIEEVWRDLGGSQGGMLSIEKLGGYKTQAKSMIIRGVSPEK